MTSYEKLQRIRKLAAAYRSRPISYDDTDEPWKKLEALLTEIEEEN